MKLVLLRHGQSEWNRQNRFTGWTDVELSELGREEAYRAGKLMRDAGVNPEYCFTSYLRRAIHTAQISLGAMERDWIPVVKDWHLNERHYGALQGLDKAEITRKYGDEQVHIWRRSYDVSPPPITPDDMRFPGHDPRYAALSDVQLPLSESLQDTIARVRICWEELIQPALRLYGTVLVAAHGNSLRGLAMMLMNYTSAQIVSVEIPTGSPWVMELDNRFSVNDQYYI